MKIIRVGPRVQFVLQPQPCVQVARRLATIMDQNLKNVMQQPKSGRKYRRGKKLHTASAPGQAPAVDTGLLISNIAITPHSTGAMVGVLRDARNIPAEWRRQNPKKQKPRILYATALEMGRKGLAARPAFRISIPPTLRRKIIPRNIISHFNK